MLEIINRIQKENRGLLWTWTSASILWLCCGYFLLWVDLSSDISNEVYELERDNKAVEDRLDENKIAP